MGDSQLRIRDALRSGGTFRDFIGFWEEHYVQAFPDPAEREPLGDIFRRLALSPLPCRYRDDAESGIKSRALTAYLGPSVVGALAVEIHEGGNAVLPIYMYILPEYRRHGVGSALIEKAISLARASRMNIFFEVERPGAPSMDRSITPRGRMTFYRGLGLRRIDFDYLSPPLTEGDGWIRNLCLLTVPRKEGSRYLKKDALLLFLADFYGTLTSKQTDPQARQGVVMETERLLDYYRITLPERIPLRDI